MPSSFTDELAIEKQAAGENINVWGDPKLNNALTRLTKGIAGYRAIALTANYSLTSSSSANPATNPELLEAYHGVLKFTGTGTYTVTIPSKANRFEVWNALTSDLIISTGSGATATLKTGEKCTVICDGTNCYRVQPTDYGAQRITSVLDPTSAQDAATKAYVDATAFSSAGGTLPGQTGNAGKFITTDGTTASWSAVPQSGVTNLVTDLAALTAADTANLATAKAFAIAMAVAL